MRIAYFDCFSGVSGDMILGALVDAGLPPEELKAELDKLDAEGLDVSFQKVSRQEIACTQAQVSLAGEHIEPDQEHHLELHRSHHDHDGDEHSHDHTHPHHHGHSHGSGAHFHLRDLLSLIHGSRLDEEVKALSARIFERLAEAEARAHGASSDQVHLHEVGALDAVADVVGAVAGLKLLGIDRIYSSPLRLGTGFVECAHGRYPVPVPGVLALCEGIPCEQTDIRAELVTPTGAAILTSIAESFGPPPPFRQLQVGHGAGKRDLREQPNLLRIRIGETDVPLERDRIVLVEANIDDMTPEVYGYLFDLLLEQGAKDVYITPVQMKKGRPGHLLSVLTDESLLDRMTKAIFSETTTIGVRYHPVERRKLPRRLITVDTGYGRVRVKVCDLDGRCRSAPEYEDCARLAREHQVPILEVYDAVRAALEEE